MAACAGIGGDVFDDWVEWVLKGHHGEKPENICHSSGVVLADTQDTRPCMALPKRQDRPGLRQLPDHLRFGAVGTAVVTASSDPVIDFDQS